MKTSLYLLLLSLLPLAILDAKEPSAIYTKNGTKEILHMWVNGKYQGYLKPGETRYTVSDGFVTDDSARQTDSGERTPVKESHGGWTNDHFGDDAVEIKTQGASQTSPVINTLQADENGVIRWTDYDWNVRNPKRPAPPTDLECENAPAIRKGNKRDIKPDIEPEAQPSPTRNEGVPRAKVKPASDASRAASVAGSTFEIDGGGSVLAFSGDGTMTSTTLNSRYQGSWIQTGNRVAYKTVYNGQESPEWVRTLSKDGSELKSDSGASFIRK